MQPGLTAMHKACCIKRKHLEQGRRTNCCSTIVLCFAVIAIGTVVDGHRHYAVIVQFQPNRFFHLKVYGTASLVHCTFGVFAVPGTMGQLGYRVFYSTEHPRVPGMPISKYSV